RDVAAALEPAIRLQHDAVSQALGGQRVVCFRKAELPRQSRVLDRSARRSAGAAVMSADENRICASLGCAGGDETDAGRRHELHADARGWMEPPQVEHQLREVLDAVD